LPPSVPRRGWEKFFGAKFTPSLAAEYGVI